MDQPQRPTSCRDAERAQAAPMLIARVSVSVPQVDVRTLGIVVYITHKLGLWNHSQVRSVLSTTSGAAGTSGLVSGKARRQLLEQLETI